MIRAKIDEKLELKFRELAMRRFGYTNLVFEDDPVEAIEGILSDIDIDSVELQHMVRDIWVSKVLSNVSNRH